MNYRLLPGSFGGESMNWVKSHDDIRELEKQYIRDHKRGLLTNSQLLNMIHRLDRISARLGANDQ
jgi:hypothetical protein